MLASWSGKKAQWTPLSQTGASESARVSCLSLVISLLKKSSELKIKDRKLQWKRPNQQKTKDQRQLSSGPCRHRNRILLSYSAQKATGPASLVDIIRLYCKAIR